MFPWNYILNFTMNKFLFSCFLSIGLLTVYDRNNFYLFYLFLKVLFKCVICMYVQIIKWVLMCNEDLVVRND